MRYVKKIEKKNKDKEVQRHRIVDHACQITYSNVSIDSTTKTRTEKKEKTNQPTNHVNTPPPTTPTLAVHTADSHVHANAASPNLASTEPLRIPDSAHRP